MRFVVDECTGPAVAHWLSEIAHDVFSVFEEKQGITDGEVFEKAAKEQRILITNDKDFGERVYRRQEAHQGVILLRLKDERSQIKLPFLESS